MILDLTWVVLVVLAISQAASYANLRHRFNKVRELLSPPLLAALKQKETYEREVLSGDAPFVQDVRIPMFVPVNILERSIRLLRIKP